MFIHLHKGVRVGESVRACTTVHACMCICQSPLSISNEQPVNEGGPCSFHSNSQEIITLCLKPFSICTTLTASFSSHLYKNPILSLPLFRSFPLFSLPVPFCCTFTPAHIWRQIKPPHWAPLSLVCFKYDELIYSIKWQMIVRGIWLLMV